jgi:hypothetical protein
MKTIHFIVNGEDIKVRVEDELPLEWATRRALRLSYNTSRPPQDWELRHESGQLVDDGICCERIPEHGHLFLTLRVSAGGNRRYIFSSLRADWSLGNRRYIFPSLRADWSLR